MAGTSGPEGFPSLDATTIDRAIARHEARLRETLAMLDRELAVRRIFRAYAGDSLPAPEIPASLAAELALGDGRSLGDALSGIERSLGDIAGMLSTSVAPVPAAVAIPVSPAASDSSSVPVSRRTGRARRRVAAASATEARSTSPRVIEDGANPVPDESASPEAAAARRTYAPPPVEGADPASAPVSSAVPAPVTRPEGPASPPVVPAPELKTGSAAVPVNGRTPLAAPSPKPTPKAAPVPATQVGLSPPAWDDPIPSLIRAHLKDVQNGPSAGHSEVKFESLLDNIDIRQAISPYGETGPAQLRSLRYALSHNLGWVQNENGTYHLLEDER